ncbi:uncharacterized protein LOC121389061 [Gigantopelta aegis]|uniref:uncharacterized protein LOC121389061 n=1 Tax=Gigantopelta aegis TaxID=1735272 RepID=UPI001B8898A8|nr:uncharacterized protein LOC121389061 [Gigantopelta aegis]
MTLTDASETYSIPKTTLFRRVRKDGEPGDVAQKGLGRFRPVFSQQQEKDLADYLFVHGESFIWFNSQGIPTAIIPICCQKPCRTSIQYGTEDGRRGFCVRIFETSSNVVTAYTRSHFSSKSSRFQQVVVMNFYRLLNSLYETYHFPPSRIYNNDETGVMTVPNKTSKVISMKGRCTRLSGKGNVGHSRNMF